MAFHSWPGKLGACLAALTVAATALAVERPKTPRKVVRAVAVPAFDFTGQMPNPVVSVPVFDFTGRMPDPVASVPVFEFTGRMPNPVVDVPAFSFVGNGGDIVVATPPLQLTARPLPSVITTGALTMTGRRVEPRTITTPPLQLTARALPTTLTTGTLTMIGRGVESRTITTPPLQLTARPLPTSISTGTLSMTGRGVESRTITTPPLQLTARPLPATLTTGTLQMTGRRAEGQAAPLEDNGAVQVQPPRPVFRLVRVTPLGSGAASIYGGTNPFDIQDVRNDVGQALQVTPIAPETPTALTLSGGLPAFEVKAGTPAHIQIDTGAQTVSVLYNGAPQAASPTTALSLDVALPSYNNASATLTAVAPWTILSRDYGQPITSSLTTCTVLLASDGNRYKLSLGLTRGATGFSMTSLAASNHHTAQPSCP